MPISEEQFRIMQMRVSKTAQQRVPEDAVEDESDLHEDIMTYCTARGWAFMHSRTDRKTTCNKGAPDFVIWASRGRVFTIECKSRTGKLRPEQLGFKVQCENNDHKILIVTNLAQFVVLTND